MATPAALLDEPGRAAGIRLEHPVQAGALVARFGSPLLVIDCAVVRRQYRALAAALPGVDLHYALKPLPEAAVVRALAEEGSWFDLATSGEIELVRAAGIPAGRCIHTHPIKRDADIRAALDFGVSTFVADNVDEFIKLQPYRQQLRMLLRLSFRSPQATVDLSRKFGCDPAAAPALAEQAAAAGLTIAGFSFHVGSQVANPDMYQRAISTCDELLRAGRARGLGPFDVLDIGGGFPIDYLRAAPEIGAFCRPIRAALAELPVDVRVIAEPGRFLCGPAGLGLATVIGRARRDGRWWYYLDDGLYGSFSGQLYDGSRYPLEPLLPHGGMPEPCVVAGPTCDSIDVVAEDIPLPELQVGDLVLGRQMGAYTSATATDFNFLPRARVLAVNVDADAS
ncbi:MAG: type III PLP-dependent enzyme [Gammaproteobacteria bacterium]|nr:type III PLP-dependent enzyme [Gammaproteobacteria bacterium]